MALKLVVQRFPRSETGETLEPEPPTEVQFTIDTVQLGRDPTSDVVLDDKLVSRQHARIWREGGAYFIQDLHSTQGTKLNDQRLTPGDAEPLRNADVLTLPGYVITFQTWNSPHVPSGEPEGTAYVATEVLRGAMKSLGADAPVLRVLSTGDRMELAPGAEVHIGRDPDTCDLVIDSEKVSRRHAKIRRDWGGVTLYDLESTNGVRVNGQRMLREVKLHDRDEIEIGGVRIMFIDPTQLREEKVDIALPPEVAQEVARADAHAASEPQGADDEPGTKMLDDGQPPTVESVPAEPVPPPPAAPDVPVPSEPISMPEEQPMMSPPPQRRGFRSWQIGLLVLVGLTSAALLVALILAE